MLERTRGPDRAVLVSLDLGAPGYREATEELTQLVLSAGFAVALVVGGRRSRPDPSTYAGSGKVEELAGALSRNRAAVVVFNHDLSPAQQRNLERELTCRVLDRTSLILEIFAQRARSHEGKLQVEMAQLQHAATRLVRGWTHLERQRGGIGLRGGPGETQLEVDRRLIAKRMKVLREKLEHLRQRRGIQRRARARASVPTVSIVGYTNAGKSTLFNRLVNASSYAADQLFATLDTTTRRIYLPELGEVAVSDTVGFIRHLPHSLVAAFRATLEEAVHADLLLHVVDASSPARDDQTEDVNLVLEEIGAAGIPQVVVLNKIDRIGLEPGVERGECGSISRVRASALQGAGIDLVRSALAERLGAIMARAPVDGAIPAGVVAS